MGFLYQDYLGNALHVDDCIKYQNAFHFFRITKMDKDGIYASHSLTGDLWHFSQNQIDFFKFEKFISRERA